VGTVRRVRSGTGGAIRPRYAPKGVCLLVVGLLQLPAVDELHVADVHPVRRGGVVLLQAAPQGGQNVLADWDPEIWKPSRGTGGRLW
jgi:hypothetical protein